MKMQAMHFSLVYFAGGEVDAFEVAIIDYLKILIAHSRFEATGRA